MANKKPKSSKKSAKTVSSKTKTTTKVVKTNTVENTSTKNGSCLKGFFAKKYEGNHMGYTFIAPKTKQDFLDEATMQCNCLAGYIEKFTEGNCLILFMRKKAAQEVSYITIELVNNSVVQAKLARNKAPSQYDIGVIEDWVEKCNKKMCG